MDAAEEALAHAQIASLLSLYYQALDVGDFDTLEAEVMAEDATWQVIQLATNGASRTRRPGATRCSPGSSACSRATSP